jgi:hypothetical protein
MPLMAGWTAGSDALPAPTPTGLRLELSSALEDPPLLGRSASGVTDLSTFLKALVTSLWPSFRLAMFSDGTRLVSSSLDSSRPGDDSSDLGSASLGALGEGISL